MAKQRIQRAEGQNTYLPTTPVSAALNLVKLSEVADRLTPALAYPMAGVGRVKIKQICEAIGVPIIGSKICQYIDLTHFEVCLYVLARNPDFPFNFDKLSAFAPNKRKFISFVRDHYASLLGEIRTIEERSAIPLAKSGFSLPRRKTRDNFESPFSTSAPLPDVDDGRTLRTDMQSVKGADREELDRIRVVNLRGRGMIRLLEQGIDTPDGMYCSILELLRQDRIIHKRFSQMRNLPDIEDDPLPPETVDVAKEQEQEAKPHPLLAKLPQVPGPASANHPLGTDSEHAPNIGSARSNQVRERGDGDSGDEQCVPAISGERNSAADELARKYGIDEFDSLLVCRAPAPGAPAGLAAAFRSNRFQFQPRRPEQDEDDSAPAEDYDA